jgi:CheY-like chemotaxis protein
MPEPSKRKIMVVDGDPAIRESMTVFLRANGYEASSAIDSYDALWQLTNGSVDVIVSDLEMPELPGFKFLAEIREHQPRTLVVALSERPAHQSELESVCADAFYPNGLQHPKRLLSIIAELLRDSALRRTQEVEFSGESVTGQWSDTTGTPHILLTCPECLKSLSIVAPSGTGWTEARESSEHTHPASSTEYLPGFGPDNWCDSARKIGSFMLRGCRYLWRRVGRRRFRDEQSADPGSGKPRAREDTKQLKGGAQSSPALHGEGREQ